MSDQRTTSRASLEQALAAEQIVNQALLDCLPVGVCRIDAAGRILVMDDDMSLLNDGSRCPDSVWV